MALLLGTIAGLISLTAVVTGVSVTLARGGGVGSTPISKPQESSEPTEKKECTVFLTGKEDTYVVVSCGGDTSTYYLFSQGKNSLEVIKGISTPNTANKRVGTPIDLWKERNWKAFKTYDTRSKTGREIIQETFPIDYKTGAKEFPFSEYIQRICPTPTGVVVRANEGYECSGKTSLDIETSEFKKTEKKHKFKETFEHHEEKRCYAKDNKNQWRKTDCDSSVTHRAQ